MPKPFSIGFILAALAVLMPLQLQAQPVADAAVQIGPKLRALLNEEDPASGWWGVMVLDLASGDVAYQHHAQKGFVPASNVKLFTTAAALDQLGPDFRYETHLFLDGPIQNDTLQGNLIVRGAGDPTLGGEFSRQEPTAVFRAWADTLRALGIRHIAGDIIGDDDIFDDTPLGYGWSWDDEVYGYSAEISGLSFHDNVIDVTITGQRQGEVAQISWKPGNTDYVEIINQTLTTKPGSRLVEGYHRARGTNTMTLSSRVASGKTDREALAVANPTLFFVHVLRTVLIEEGLLVAGKPVDVDDLSDKPSYQPGASQRVATHRSPPLSEIVKIINKESQNLYAEALLRTLGASFKPGKDAKKSAQKGLSVAKATYAAAGIDTTLIHLVDGSGLSRNNLVTPHMTAMLLQYMWHHPRASTRTAFYDSLPIGGVDGTLESRFLNGPAQGQVHAKTGSLSNISALSGYISSRRDKPLAFVLLSNHYLVPNARIRALQEQIVTLLMDKL